MKKILQGSLGSMQVDAAIVRIMKTRKVLSHTLLITELYQQVTLWNINLAVYIIFVMVKLAHLNPWISCLISAQVPG